ncbi:alcohol dehydrogenase [acceptor] [Variibacter gotjawalensis]|uniref:Alcohol dehydrogenase [acceptor] n=1 Tax=Variibacter gotjawalensis TaxID=1333996 RepID=A0A0S3PPV8_9BRAD|nr:FAD-dependent oxidoreductase [Variibacter gotjawalensis]NIK48221.1 choline dehydrogenase [Variibacter gotjawalensis]RZS50092.1 choline dehydrogenase [Variibacter gotjawalensis]BAT57923.1 alcohol dehydrogenase [acceptor] [Variibacter gotjawalensis]
MQHDYIVIGAGSAGCVIAARLAEAGYTVNLIEAGGADSHPWIQIPAGVAKLLYDPRFNWMYASEPEAGTDNRAIHTPRGKVLGGSSSINGMLYVRGNPADYDGWAQLGNRGWSFDDVKHLFRRSETYEQGGDTTIRGDSGPWRIQDYRTILPVTHMFVRAAQEAGFPFTPDYNGASQEGVGYSQMNKLGRWRGSSYRAFLASDAAKRNVTITTNATVSSLLIENGAAIGIRFSRGGRNEEARANREVIVSAGAIGSPQILQLSGIGDPEHLGSLGIKTQAAVPGVGRNLSDHYVGRLVARLRGLETLNELSRGWRLVREIAKFGLMGNGALTMGVTSAMVFCRSREGLASPDLQLLFTPASYVFGKALVVEKEPGITIAVCPTRPSSRGTVMIHSADPNARPKIHYRYLTDPDDIRVLLAGLDHSRRIFAAPAFRDHLIEETRPGASITAPDDIEAFVRREGTTLYHPVGTCRMGIDPNAVVDPELKVRGIRNLRVADASVMPYLTTGNTQAPTIMIAEKASDMLLADAKAARAA